MVQGSGRRVQGSGFRVQGSGFRVQGEGQTSPVSFGSHVVVAYPKERVCV